MQKTHEVTKKVTATILSMSLLTVMAGAAIAPALGIIKAHFTNVPDLLIQLIVSIPALLIIITNLFFLKISQHLRTRAIATTGLLLYIIAGAGCFFINDIYLLLLMRAVLGVSVGLIMPLSTGLLAYYFPPEEQARLMGLSAAMNQMGGVVATLLAGLLATIEWNYAFLVYLLGLIALLSSCVATRRATGFCQQERRAFRASTTTEVPSLGVRDVAADDNLLHLPHQLCHHHSPTNHLGERNHHHHYGRFGCRGFLCRHFLRATDACIQDHHQIFRTSFLLDRIWCLPGRQYRHDYDWCHLHRHCHWNWRALSQHHCQHQGRQELSHHSDAFAVSSSLSRTVCITHSSDAVVACLLWSN